MLPRSACATSASTCGGHRQTLLPFLCLGLVVGLAGDLLLDLLPVLDWVEGEVEWGRWLSHLVLVLLLFLVGWLGATPFLDRWLAGERLQRLSTGEPAAPPPG